MQPPRPRYDRRNVYRYEAAPDYAPPPWANRGPPQWGLRPLRRRRTGRSGLGRVVLGPGGDLGVGGEPDARRATRAWRISSSMIQIRER